MCLVHDGLSLTSPKAVKCRQCGPETHWFLPLISREAMLSGVATSGRSLRAQQLVCVCVCVWCGKHVTKLWGPVNPSNRNDAKMGDHSTKGMLRSRMHFTLGLSRLPRARLPTMGRTIYHLMPARRG